MKVFSAFIGIQLSASYAQKYTKYSLKSGNPSCVSIPKRMGDNATNAAISRDTGELTTQLRDDFDLLSVNHFFNLFDAYYDMLFRVDGSGSTEKKRG